VDPGITLASYRGLRNLARSAGAFFPISGGLTGTGRLVSLFPKMSLTQGGSGGMIFVVHIARNYDLSRYH